MLKFSFFFEASVCVQVLSPTEILSATLQSSLMSVTGAKTASEQTVSQIRRLMSEWSALWGQMTKAAAELQLDEPCLPRQRRLPAKLDSSSSTTHQFGSPPRRIFQVTVLQPCRYCGRINCTAVFSVERRLVCERRTTSGECSK